MRLLHYSAEPLPALSEITKIEQSIKSLRHIIGKPRGFWVSVQGEYDWEWWCRAENFQLENLKYETEVVLKPNAKVLIIKSAAMLEGFNKKYKYEAYPGATFNVINWEWVAAEWDGIIIAPYQWRHRLGEDTFWYYSWDCASGCIWNPEVIDKLVPIKINKLLAHITEEISP